MSTAYRLKSFFVVLVLCFAVGVPAFAQMETATLSGVIQDPNGRVVPDVEVSATRIETGTAVTTKTNGAGIYFFTGLVPGHYHLMVRKPGFKEIAIKQFELQVQDKLEQNFSLEIGSVNETVTVEGGSPLVNTTDATVSTVIDRQFAENLPLNGRSFQSLVQLTPGVVVTSPNAADQGQFSVNGQRTTSNYWMVDGVSANIGSGGTNTVSNNSNGLAGTIGSFSALGGTNSLVSIDAMQEFRIQTSTYAPEFGRTPGAQISIATRSGTNRLHGTLFDYLRNDALDANNWFNTSVTPALPKPKERQNDFGGTFSGPIFKNRTFFFFSYEGLRLRLPQTVISTVPDLAARQTAVAAMQPFLNAYPLPNGTDNAATGVAGFNSSFSSSSSLDATSLRVDHRWNNKISLFARYNYSPSEIIQRGGGTLAPSVVTPIKITTQTGTAGVTWSISPSVVNDLRFNYSRTNATSRSFLDNFGGAVPLAALPFPAPFTAQNGLLRFTLRALRSGLLTDGIATSNVQRQINLVDSLSLQEGSHSLKFGIDFRRLSPVGTPEQYLQSVVFNTVARAKTGNPLVTVVDSFAPVYLLFRNLGAFAQDTWRVAPRLTVTYGLRWDVDFAPSSLNGPNLPAVTGFNLNDLSQLAIAPAGTPPFKTSYDTVAPRVGVAFQVRQNPDWQTALRGGFGIFYDLAGAQTGALIQSFPPFAQMNIPASPFPLSAASSTPPVIPSAATLANVLAINPKLQLPYTLQWNVALEQALGRQQALTLSYVGAAGRRLLQSTFFNSPASNPNIKFAAFVNNSATSDYDALQVQFQRRLSHGLQAQASYSWSHSIDKGSSSSGQVASNEGVPGGGGSRGPSDFDIRHAFSVGLTYEVPAPVQKPLLKVILRGWSVENIFQARSAPPVDVSDNNFFQFSSGVDVDVRPDLVPGQPLYLFGPQFPGGKAFNPAAFTDPPTTPAGCVLFVNCTLTRQGTLGRNALRGFGAAQWDFAVHHDFSIRESLKLQFRAEMFNVINHPNFGQPSGLFPSGSFGLSSQTLNQNLAGSGTVGSGGFNPLYQIGGPRSVQFGLKFMF